MPERLTISPMANSPLPSPPPTANTAGGHSSPVSGSTMAMSPTGRPSEPVGVSGVRLMATPPSLEPYPSVSAQPNRRSKAAWSASDASVPNPRRKVHEASSASGGVAST